MPPPPRPNIKTISTSSIPLQTSRPNFRPFFTLINDSTTQSTHHPSRIHYIFSDDDESEVLTAACVRALQNEGGDSPSASRDLEHSGEGVRESGTSSSSSATFKRGDGRERRKGKAPVKREERVLIVDVNDTGDGIVSTSSLNSSWQVVNAEIANAPTLDHDTAADEGGGEGERGLMLKIEGVGTDGLGEEMVDSGERRKGKTNAESNVMGEEEMQALLEGFDRKMVVLRKIVASGESWDEARRGKGMGGGAGGNEALLGMHGAVAEGSLG